MINNLRHVLNGCKTIAMEYSKNSEIPYISVIDGGIIELVRSFGVEVVSSAEIIQSFYLIDEVELKSHYEAGEIIKRALFDAFEEIKRSNKTEYELSHFIYSYLIKNHLTTDGDLPIVAVDENSSNPHYFPQKEHSKFIKRGSKILIDIWARKPNGIYYDVTWMAFFGKNVDDEFRRVFEIVRDARDLAVDFINERISRNSEIRGYEVDSVVRDYIRRFGLGDYFIHRTGHSIGYEVHSYGVNLDNFETHDFRRIVQGSLFSVEPGIYIPGKFGVRSEIDVYVHNNKAEITTIKQEHIVLIN
jgi:Xaa-Pro aminopeptidase